MLQEERFLRIRSLLATFSRLSVDRIVQDLAVSRETVRRDLLELEGLGELRRVHGGAIATSAEPEPPLAVRLVARQREKRAIAKAAIALLSPVGLHARHGAMSFEHHEATIARAMAEQAQQLVLLADHAKIGQASRVTYARPADIHVVITDAKARELPGLPALRKACERLILA